MTPKLDEHHDVEERSDEAIHLPETELQCNEGIMKLPCVYIMANRPRGTLYTGVTSNLPQRTWEHKEHIVGCFTSRYSIHRLVWYEVHETMDSAIMREKQIKAGPRRKKIQLIETVNPQWTDLYTDIL